jgi:hypothetical protein
MEDTNHGWDRVAWITKQLSRACNSGQIDYPLEIRGSPCPKLTGEVFPTDAEPGCQGGRADRKLDFTEQYVPGLALEWFGQSKHAWGLCQRPAALRRDRGAYHHFPDHWIIHPLDGNRRDSLPARQQQLAIVGAERRIGNQRNQGPSRSQLRQLGEKTTVRGENNSVHQASLEQAMESGSGLTGDYAGSPLGNSAPKREHGSAAFEKRSDGGHLSGGRMHRRAGGVGISPLDCRTI